MSVIVPLPAPARTTALEPEAAGATVLGVVLAGGRSSRMGRDKALLPAPETNVGWPITLVERQVALLRGLGLVEVVVSIGAGRQRAELRSAVPPDVRLLADPDEGLGPLAGIVTAMRAAAGGPVLVVAVDMPYVDRPFLARLLAFGDERTGCAPTVGGRPEPLCALYPAGALATAAPLLAGGGVGAAPSALVNALLRAGRMRRWEVSRRQVPRLGSWNSPSDLRRGADVARRGDLPVRSHLPQNRAVISR